MQMVDCCVTFTPFRSSHQRFQLNSTILFLCHSLHYVLLNTNGNFNYRQLNMNVAASMPFELKNFHTNPLVPDPPTMTLGMTSHTSYRGLSKIQIWPNRGKK
jgi:hypothetical protein